MKIFFFEFSIVLISGSKVEPWFKTFHNFRKLELGPEQFQIRYFQVFLSYYLPIIDPL